MAAQRRQGYDVYLLTLTHGEATKVRFLNLPDGGLKELDPWTIEKSIRGELLRVEPHVVVTFPIHGISGFPRSHCHALCGTRVYLELQSKTRSHPSRIFVTDSGPVRPCANLREKSRRTRSLECTPVQDPFADDAPVHISAGVQPV